MSQTQHPSYIKYLPYLVAATFFMEYLDTTVLATALPQMARSFGVGPNELSLGMTAYMLALAVFIPISGWIAERFGSRTVFATAIFIFTVASILCGASNGIFEFTAARLLQGVGGAMMVPVGRLIVVRSVDKSQLMKAIATITWPAIAAPVIGPPVGGFITTYASWRWIFLLNVPFGAIALILAWKMLRNVQALERRSLDITGFLLSAATLTCILYGTELASDRGAPTGMAILLVVVGIVLGVVAVRHASGRANALLDYTTLHVPTFSVTVVSGSITRIGIGAVPYLMPLLFQIGFGMSAFHAGLLMLATAVGNLGTKAVTTRILQRYGFRSTSLAAVSIGGLSIIACGFLTPASPMAWVMAVIFVYGVMRSMQFSTLATLAYADIPAPQMNSANTLWNAANQMAIGLGIAVGALALRLSASLHASPLAGGSPAQSTATVDHLSDLNHFSLADFRWAFIAAGILTLISLIGYYRLSPDAGRHLQKTKTT